MDQTGDVAQTRGRLDKRMHGLARGRVDRGDAHLVAGVRQDLCRRIRIVMAHIGQQDMLTEPNPPRDSLPDLASADDDNDISHRYSLWCATCPVALCGQSFAPAFRGSARPAP